MNSCRLWFQSSVPPLHGKAVVWERDLASGRIPRAQLALGCLPAGLCPAAAPVLTAVLSWLVFLLGHLLSSPPPALAWAAHLAAASPSPAGVLSPSLQPFALFPSHPQSSLRLLWACSPQLQCRSRGVPSGLLSPLQHRAPGSAGTPRGACVGCGGPLAGSHLRGYLFFKQCHLVMALPRRPSPAWASPTESGRSPGFWCPRRAVQMLPPSTLVPEEETSCASAAPRPQLRFLHLPPNSQPLEITGLGPVSAFGVWMFPVNGVTRVAFGVWYRGVRAQHWVGAALPLVLSSSPRSAVPGFVCLSQVVAVWAARTSGLLWTLAYKFLGGCVHFWTHSSGLTPGSLVTCAQPLEEPPALSRVGPVPRSHQQGTRVLICPHPPAPCYLSFLKDVRLVLRAPTSRLPHWPPGVGSLTSVSMPMPEGREETQIRAQPAPGTGSLCCCHLGRSSA